MHVSIGVAL